MKKILALLVAFVMALGMVPAVAAEAPVELTILLCGNNVTDDTTVMEKVNAYLAEKIGVTLKPQWATWADFDDRAVNAINSGDSSIDMMFACSWTDNNYSVFSSRGAYVRLDDPDNNLVEKYGQDAWALLPKVLTDAAVVTNGEDGEGVYGVPGFKDIATINSWDLNMTLLEKYGYTFDDVNSAGFFGWGDIFKTVKEGEGESFYPFIFEGFVAERMVDGVSIVTGDTRQMLSFYFDPENVDQAGKYGMKIMNKYATPEFEAFAKQMRAYFVAGYIDPSIAIRDLATDTWRNAQNTAQYLISSEVTLYGYEFTTSAKRGIDVQYLYANEPYIDNTSAQGALLVISANSEHPEESMKFLNLLNTDPYLVSLMAYGVEGVHYNLNDAGEVVFTAEHENFLPWVNGLGNVTLLAPTEGQGSDFQARFKNFYANSKMLPIYGFTFDPTPVKNEVAACANITEQYGLTLDVGAADVDTVLPEFLKKLEDAGMQKIVDEANRQLEEFLAAKEAE